MHRTIKAWWIVAGMMLVAGLIGVGVILTRPPSLVPKNIATEITSTIFVPIGTAISYDRNSMAVSKPQGTKDTVLNFNASIDGTRLVIGEQPTPQQFTDIPKVYDRVAEQAKQYDTFESAVGTVKLTRPKGYQIAKLNAKGTYLLIQANKDLSTDQWRRLFKGMQDVSN